VGIAARVRRPANIGKIALLAFAVFYGTASVAVALRVTVPSTYAATSTSAAAADLAAGVGLMVAGLFLSLKRPSGSIGVLTTLLGAVWLAADWVGWDGGWELARSLGMVAAPFLLPLLFHLVAAFPSGRIEGAIGRVTVGLVYAGAVVYSVGRALYRDPFLDLYCWSNCTDNAFLLRSERPLVATLDSGWLRFSVVVGVVLVGVCVWRLFSATRPARATTCSVLVPAALVVAAGAAYAIVLARDPAEAPDKDVFRIVFFGRALSLVCLAVGITWTVIRAMRMQSSISRLGADLGEAPQPGSLRIALAESLGDQDLEVSYWLAGSHRYVDATGHPVEPAKEGERAVTPIVRGGEPVAIVVHDHALSGARTLEREIGAAARLAVDNERLGAEVLAQLEDLRASRARIVEKGDTSRRLLERDLHDGAQQRLLAVSYALRLARAEVESNGDADVAALLAQATDEAQTTLKELRELAHGIYPAVLSEAGLGPALWTLADDAPIAIEIGDATEARYPDQIETAAYFVAAEGLGDAAHRGAEYATASAVEQEGLLVVAVSDDGSQRTSSMVHVADRVGALAGRLEVGPNNLRAELPCE
jgi:signal transduction histidine kinase